MGVATLRCLYQYKPAVQKHSEIGKNAYAMQLALSQEWSRLP